MTKHEDEWQAVAQSVYDELADNLDELAWMNIPFNDNFELAMHELTSREIRLNSGVVFEEWLKTWHTHQVFLEDKEIDLEQSLKICFEEKTVSMTRNLLKKKIQEKTPLNLGQTVEPVCAKNDNFRITANRIQKRVVAPMAGLMVWAVDCEMRDVGGQQQPREWRIDVGPSLSWFQELVGVPFRKRQIFEFMRKHGGSLG
nr:hypothetical protein [uncultured bacterium]